MLEQAFNLWHTSITKEQEQSLERVQKSALKIFLNNKYLSFSNACDTLNIVNLKSRRQQLFERFTAKNINHQKLKQVFKEKNTKQYNLRNINEYEVKQARTKRLEKSTIIRCKNLQTNKLQLKKTRTRKQKQENTSEILCHHAIYVIVINLSLSLALSDLGLRIRIQKRIWIKIQQKSPESRDLDPDPKNCIAIKTTKLI